MPLQIVVIGGRLQGVESLYLAKKAGIRTVLVDKNPLVIGAKMADAFLCCNVHDRSDAFINAMRQADWVLPAMENDGVLALLRELKEQYSLNVCFDWDAYAISSSKLKSNALMKAHGILMPVALEAAAPPYIAKPSSGSGSDDVLFIPDEAAFEAFKRATPDYGSWVIQAYCPGKQYSIEVVGTPGSYRTYAVTDLFMDLRYDCKRVAAPTGLPKQTEEQFRTIAKKLAATVNLRGMMDVEVIDDGGTLRVLEIDARMPSQTPAVVYHSTGVNLLVELLNVYSETKIKQTEFRRPLYACYEHLHTTDTEILALGEHIMCGRAPLKLYENGAFCASDEALTDYDGGSQLTAIMMNKADSFSRLEQKRQVVREAVGKTVRRALAYNDASPYDHEHA